MKESLTFIEGGKTMRDYMMPSGGLGGVPLREMPSWFERREVLGLKNGR